MTISVYPNEVSPQREGDAGWFWLRLFTAEERARWNMLLKHAASLSVAQLLGDAMLTAVVSAETDIQRARLISLDNASVIQGVSVLCRYSFNLGGGLVLTVLATDARRDEVLSGLVVG